MSTIRELLVELTGTAEYADQVGDDVDLAASGIDSGDLVRLVLLVEQRLGVEITAEDMEGLRTIADYERFVAGHSAAGASGVVGASGGA
ncbi:acyl carrier protein [Streptomyces rochei]|uniref:Acyl carrier protein n=3 Tax=Streptomyces rochei group TaxID=2867164 RepID=A0AAX3ZB51_STRRO|nr:MULTISPECIES: acyl carrier protein [Streptomyces]MDV6291031.1 acyl carrier protein [Streptomyces sp. UP1A-1]RIH59410.1 acyl carrier protein [Streptomyces sp. SHP22-7]WDI16279.1 acyl carrier protein [Streptomyces enissocaesilis]KYK10388.1 acyl carrier protein [Streptomyces sp. CC71]MBJ6617718.1 acyl carrier protein [Streptomyces sp. DHE17-7]